MQEWSRGTFYMNWLPLTWALNRFVNYAQGRNGYLLSWKYEFMVWGDPAGQQRDQIYETTAFDHMRTMDMHARPCATNDFKVRREALAIPMQRLIEGKPGFLINKKCERLRKSLAGGYHFKRVSMGAGQERYRSLPQTRMNIRTLVMQLVIVCLVGVNIKT